ncbi:MAG TPA: Hpt domain-containing protein [Thermoanaerobaculia bacterium]|nr:Hpt domain-containing protein [Thermoanaerobaculia bacterium]
MSTVVIPDALRARFFERLAERVVTLQATVAAFDDGLEARDSLERQLHSLAGIAGTYGFGGLTDLARDGELRCGAGAELAELRSVVEAIAEAAARTNSKQ